VRKRIGVIQAEEVDSRQIAARSRVALDRPLAHAAELWISVARDRALLLGAFQRNAGVVRADESDSILRRGSGGPEVVLAEGTVHVALALAEPGALGPCDEQRIVNRLVRPLLRALTKTGYPAHFFGRDWISVLHRPAAWVGFAHDATTRRTLFEAFIAVRTPFAASPRPSFLGKELCTLEASLGRRVDTTRLVRAVVAAYLDAYDLEPVDTAPPSSGLGESAATLADDSLRAADPPWTATCEEAIGLLGAGPDARGVFRVGGDLLVSRDALARLESRAAEAPEDEIARITDETLGAPGVALDGIRSLKSVRDLIERARRRQ
jgi:hypothetical protein